MQGERKGERQEVEGQHQSTALHTDHSPRHPHLHFLASQSLLPLPKLLGTQARLTPAGEELKCVLV